MNKLPLFLEQIFLNKQGTGFRVLKYVDPTYGVSIELPLVGTGGSAKTEKRFASAAIASKEGVSRLITISGSPGYRFAYASAEYSGCPGSYLHLYLGTAEPYQIMIPPYINRVEIMKHGVEA